jgi:hypothetical protein
MVPGSDPHLIRRRLGVPADAAWRIMTSRAGTRRWLDDDSHPGVRIGALIPLSGSGPAEVAGVGPGTEIELSFASGRRAVLRVSALASGCELAVADYGIGGQQTDALASTWQALLTQVSFVTDQVKASRRVGQAIVVINGVGGQQPLSAIKAIADALVDRSDRYSKPDMLSASYELRRYQIERTRNRPRTDLFELYWADKVPGTRVGDVLSWLRSIALRRPRDVSDRLRPIASLIRMVAVAAVAAIALLLAEIGISGLGHLWQAANTLAELAWVSVGVSLAGGVISGFLIACLGDAARYLDAAPGNIAVRQAIRQSGVDLLRRLHDEGQYDRVVIVGNALGSVIGYDIIRLYWTQVHKSHISPIKVDQTQLEHYQDLVAKYAGTARPWTTAQMGEYRKAQRDLWREYRRLGLPWLITDLVTIGSPLTYADTLLARSPADLDDIIKDRELPTCPPRLDGDKLTQAVTYLTDGHIRTLKMPTFNVPFAVTRWTNVYAPSKAVIFGDPIGGPLAPVFGPGIKDIPVNVGPWWRRWTPLAHTSYWRCNNGGEPTSVIQTITESVGVESGYWLNAHVSEMPWEASLGALRTDEPS